MESVIRRGSRVRCTDATHCGSVLEEGREYVVESIGEDELARLVGVRGQWALYRFQLLPVEATKPAPEKKETNPKDRCGIAKVPFSTLSAQVMAEVGLAMFEGARKYGRYNYRAVGILASVYYDAAQRHLTDWWEGTDIDPDSGLSHVTKAIACLMVMRDAMLQAKMDDDRPPKALNREWMKELNATAKALLEKYPEPLDPWTQKRVSER